MCNRFKYKYETTDSRQKHIHLSAMTPNNLCGAERVPSSKRENKYEKEIIDERVKYHLT